MDEDGRAPRKERMRNKMKTSNQKTQANGTTTHKNGTDTQVQEATAKTSETSPHIIDPSVLVLDCTDVGPYLVDLQAGARKGMRGELKGLNEVLAEIATNQTTLGERAGVTEADMERFQTLNERIAIMDQHLIRVRTLAELLTESRAKLEDDRQRQISAIAATVEARAKAFKDDVLLARYEKTRTYRSSVGIKAAKTRRRNAGLASVAAASNKNMPSA
jgi:hypothetical protein